MNEKKEFLSWIAKEINDENFELNKDSFAEITCRKLVNLGIVKEEEHEDGTYYAYDFPEEEDIKNDVDDLVYYIAENVVTEDFEPNEDFTQDLIHSLIDLGIIKTNIMEEKDNG